MQIPYQKQVMVHTGMGCGAALTWSSLQAPGRILPGTEPPRKDSREMPGMEDGLHRTVFAHAVCSAREGSVPEQATGRLAMAGTGQWKQGPQPASCQSVEAAMAPTGLSSQEWRRELVPGRDEEMQERSSLLLYPWATCERRAWDPWEPLGARFGTHSLLCQK